MIAGRFGALCALLLLGCSSDEPALPEEDAALDGAPDATLDSAPDATLDGAPDATLDGAPDAMLDSALDATLDVLVEVSPDAPALDSAVADAVADVDLTFTLPTWAPVCFPASSDGGADADEVAPDTLDDSDAAEDVGDGSTDATEAGTCTGVRLRVLASNLTSGSASVYDTPGIHILQGLHPDLVLLQELKYPAGIRALVDTAFDTSFHYATELDPGAIPNGIVSRYPILEAGEWDDPDLTDRDFVWARIDVPGAIDLYAVSVHLRTTSSSARDAEAKNLVAYVKSKVPSGAYLVIGGDFNTASDGEPALFDLAEVVSVAAPYAVDQAGIVGTNAPRSKPYDWVLPNPMLRARMIPVSIGAASFPSGLVFDSRVFSPLADVAPVIATDSAATNMQHMAVVRDFVLGD